MICEVIDIDEDIVVLRSMDNQLINIPQNHLSILVYVGDTIELDFNVKIVKD